LGRGLRRVRGAARRGRRGVAATFLRRTPCKVQTAEVLPRRRLVAAQRARQGPEVRAEGDGVTEVVPVPTNVDGRPLSARGLNTRRRLLSASEAIFADLGY